MLKIMVSKFSLSISIMLAFLLLASCATVKEQVATEPAGWVAEQNKRQQIKNWEIRGRLGIQTEHEGGTLDIIWKQAGQDFSIRLIAPLGSGNYLVQGNNDSVEIRYPDGSIKIVDSIDKVFSSTLNINFPASAVKDWLRGLPAQSLTLENITWNQQGLLNTVRQFGWNVELKKYTGENNPMPHAIYVSRDDDTELDIRLLLRQWLIDN